MFVLCMHACVLVLNKTKCNVRFRVCALCMYMYACVHVLNESADTFPRSK